jgi:hypothetical protein
MGFYSTLCINVCFRKEAPKYITDYFHKGTKNERLPSFLVDFGFNFDKKIDLACPNTLLCEYAAKTYIDDEPQNRYYLSLLIEFDIDKFADVFLLLTTLAAYCEDNFMVGYFKHEDEKTDLIAFKNGLPYWSHGVKIEMDETKKQGKLDYFELCALGQKIAQSEGTEAQINQLMTDFDLCVPYPKGSSLFFYPENYNARKADISKYNPRVEEIVQKCLNYEVTQL